MLGNKTDICAISLHPTESHKVKFQDIARFWVIPGGRMKKDKKPTDELDLLSFGVQ
jgi:hypothetical protein